MAHILPKLIKIPNALTGPQVEDPPIPPILHVIWVGPRTIPDYATANINKWRELLPEPWTVRLWTNADLTEEYFDKDYLEKINSSKSGAQKADLMKYYIIAKTGGFYSDTDVIPYRSLEPIRKLGYNVILCHDNDITWGYCAVGFFGATHGHPLLLKAVEICKSATLNTPDIHLHTGPRVMGLSLEQTPGGEEKWPLLTIQTFYVNTNPIYDSIRIGTHTYAKEW